MLTMKRVEEMMAHSLRNPFNLAERLGLVPTPEQTALMDRFSKDEEPLVLAETEEGHLVRAAALCALWRLLLVPGSSCRIISSSRKLTSEFMEFMYNITSTIDPVLQSVCKWRGPKVMKLGDDDAYELRLISNKAKWLHEKPQVPTTFVILGASSSEPAFTEARQAVEAHSGVEGVRTITVW